MVAQGNVGLAFGLVAAAGMATCLGACIVWCASLARKRLLAASLGFAAGVMLFVSFAEIMMRKSLASFQAVSGSADAAYRWTMLAFFGGMLAIALLDKLVHAVAHLGATHAMRKGSGAGASASTANLLTSEDQREARQGDRPSGVPPPVAVMQRGAGGAGGAAQPAQRDVEQLGSAGTTPRAQQAQRAAAGAAAGDSESEDASVDGRERGLSAPAPMVEPCCAVTSAVLAASCPDTVVGAGGADGGASGPGGGSGEGGEDGGGGHTSSRTPPAVVEIMEADHHSFMLKKMGLLTALAIFIHNFPEGLATFVGALADTSVGVGLAVAIAMHNIPEGICVAMPIYYATGSRWKGFWWAFLSGVSEPVGALVGYLALSGSNDLSFGIVFGLVSGMMVYISIKELIPTALRYDPQDSVATTAVVVGMVVMATSLLLFTL